MREAVGSSPSVSTTSLRTAYRSQRLFCKSHFSLILSQLLSKSNPLSLGFDSVFYPDWGIFFLSILPTSSRTAYRSRRRFLIQSKRRLSFIPSLLPPQSRRLCRGPKYKLYIACGIHFCKCYRRTLPCFSFAQKVTLAAA